MGCATGCARFILAVLNLVIGIIWLAVTVLGGILAWGTPVIRNVLEHLLNQFAAQLQKDSGVKVDFDSIVQFIIGLSRTIGIVLFVIGLILTLITLAGLCGACCDSPTLLYIFAVAMCVLVVGQLIFVIIYFANPDIFFNPAEKAMTDSTKLYQGYKAQNPESILWNLLNLGFQCCGSTDATNFNNATNWDHKEEYNGANITVQYPVTCCNKDQTNATPSSCPVTFTEQNSYIKTPCFPKLRSNAEEYSHIVMYVFIADLVLQSILTAMAFAVACAHSKKGKTY